MTLKKEREAAKKGLVSQQKQLSNELEEVKGSEHNSDRAVSESDVFASEYD